MASQPPLPDEQWGEAPEQTLPLSDRQLQILALVAEGWTDNEIAIQLYISVKTVYWC
jgi:DNA-binding NarL/FixJ family response regulator